MANNNANIIKKLSVKKSREKITLRSQKLANIII